MEILLAKSAGFCFGVKRATQMAFDASDNFKSLQSLGPLIHSPQMVKKLEDRGIRVCQRVEDADGEAIVVRSHGVTAGEFVELQGSGKTIIDATCPFVTKAQKYAAELSRDGYLLVIVGEAHHPEVQGIVSYASGEVAVIASAEEAGELPKSRKIGVIAQTTQSFENFRAIVGVCLDKSRQLKIHNTICDATSVRQEEAVSIAGQVDLMLVVGGYNSANTTRLANLCRDKGTATYHVETAGEIDRRWFEGVSRVGLTAGASTPQFLIDEIMEILRTF
ncbi:4-hydroxy-3-methylbut-2-enyl diphosphate reductase [Geopsychrobacter electrodiphilus]|uniref:4-hydroxy-3-methylbut-2-enyl diphosphate reductase n=1 Tax=Geopsychrobacter electrodiphilus TaxID=225196 RepID=UPI00037D3B5D|nr:4-hydroxy-3-methylbut-2-enyl diphosphate reductase [Geopsychrobacter electrodiphilus]